METGHEFWRFATSRFAVTASAVEDCAADLSWADEETLEDIESGRLAVFGVQVEVRWFVDGDDEDGEVVGGDSLWGCVYRSVAEFRDGHRDSDPMSRNCSIMRAARGDNVVICHYFPNMVRQAVADARSNMARRKAGLAHLRMRAAA